MEENINFQMELEESIIQKTESIEKTELPKLKGEFQRFFENFRNFLDLLKRKSMVKEDPYKYEQKISEVTVPPTGPFMESEKSDQLSIRLSGLEIQLDFLVNYYQFSLEFLNIGRLKKLIALTKYIDWKSLTKTSTNLTTQLIADAADRIKGGTDKFSSKILFDLQKQLFICTDSIMKKLKPIAVLQREKYKLNIRQKLLPKLYLTQENVKDQDEVIKIFKRKFSIEMGDSPFYRELILEILDEDFTPEGAALRTTLINKLRVEQKKEKKKKKTITYKSILMDAIRFLGQAGRQYEDIIKKLKINTVVMDNRKVSFGEKLKQWLKGLLSNEDEKHIYIVDYFDLRTSSTKTHRINFTKYAEDILQKANLLSSFSNKLSTPYRKIEAMDEERILEFISEDVEELQENMKKFSALSTFFKSEIPRNDRVKFRNIKLELGALKNLAIKANQKKHDYVAKKEEVEQLKKLGVSIENIQS